MAFARVTDRRFVVTSLLSLGLLGLVAAAASACSEESSPAPVGTDAEADGALASDATADSSADASACTPPGSFGSTKCNACVLGRCCDRVAACAADPACKTLSECTLACIRKPDAGACAADCATATPEPAGLWKALEKCAYFSEPCAFECSNAPN